MKIVYLIHGWGRSSEEEWFVWLKEELAKKGMMIPDNDIWIAALARQNDVALAHRDEHFQSITGIQMLKW